MGIQLTSDWPECFVASTSAAVVLCMSSGWGAPESKTWGIVHLRRGCLAAATLAVAADAAEGILRCRSRQTASRKMKKSQKSMTQLLSLDKLKASKLKKCVGTHLLKLFGGDTLLPLWCIRGGGLAWM